MKGRIRGWWPLFAVVAAFWVLYAVWRSPHRTDLATYGAFAAAVVTLVAGWMASDWRSRASAPGPSAAGQERARLADLLALAVQTQWERAAGERGLVGAEPIPVTWGKPSLPLAGPIAAASRSQHFAPLPGMAPVEEAQLASGQIRDLHAVYGGIGSGRLVIAGGPGSGKSGAAVLLVLAALKHREQVPAKHRVKVPVTVLFTAQDWDPRRQPLREWLTRRLRETYPLFAGRTGAQDAAGLVDAGKIAVILDGLDEIAEELRPVALQALSQQASFRLIVLTRTAEMASAASQRGVLQGAAAIELRALDSSTAADYLERVQLDPPPDAWRDLVGIIRSSPGSPLANALNSPLTLTLVRDTYQSGNDARELLDYSDAEQQRVSGAQATEEITGHLLDRILPSAYAHRPGQPAPRYDLRTAQNALAKIAARMNQEGTRDLRWWRIPEWASPIQRVTVAGLVAGLVTGLVTGLGFGLGVGLTTGLAVGLLVGIATFGSKDPPTRREGLRLRLMFTRMNIESGVVAGLLAGLAAGLRVGLVVGLGGGFVALLGGGLVVGRRVGLAAVFADPDTISSPSPAIAWQDDRSYALAVGLVFGLGAALAVGLGVELMVGFTVGLRTGLRAGLTAGLLSGLVGALGASRIWSSTAAMAQLAREWHTPVHLMNFLDDAHGRNVLRTVGPMYQFRHARLQDRLAAANNNSDRP